MHYATENVPEAKNTLFCYKDINVWFLGITYRLKYVYIMQNKKEERGIIIYGCSMQRDNRIRAFCYKKLRLSFSPFKTSLNEKANTI